LTIYGSYRVITKADGKLIGVRIVNEGYVTIEDQARYDALKELLRRA
jgi:hypothetical protein